MGGHHHHEHGHGHHAHAALDHGAAFRIGIILNLGYVVLEAGFGLVSGSMALLADAGHNLSDVLGLALAWGAAVISKRPPSERFTFGLKRSTILAALANAALLLVACGAIAFESVHRFFDPRPVPGGTVMIVAGIGVVINLGTALLFARGRHGDLNIRGAYLHMMADAGISAAVVVSGLLILQFGWQWLDSVISLLVVAVILRGTWNLLTESVAAALDAVPRHIDPAEVSAFLASQPGIVEVHHLHIWQMGTTDVALTAHLVAPAGHPGDAALRTLTHQLEHRFGIGHATIQIESGESRHCPSPCAIGDAVSAS
ncbi:cation diffusion facilitator family transporter [Polymorphobacter sp.]|uniref:cation diffusion facilitator family transporter n=1 Tax=Polymorphobacter sp. TaxID=1909290 RepID=UPI003F6EF40E